MVACATPCRRVWRRPAPWWIAIHATTEYDQAAADWLTGRLGEQEQVADQLGVPVAIPVGTWWPWRGTPYGAGRGLGERR